ncbi:MAG: tetratricopeptide repeat protein [Proteobacteria bacterium]|nr:tetratricopeptide repeat protein [Pseudomonadota bacterium]
MADVFDEISDDLRQEKLHQFWRENGSWLIGGVIAAIALTAGISLWRQWEQQRNVATTTELIRLVEAANVTQLERFSDASDKNHAAIARLLAASAHLDRGEKTQAIELYNGVAATFGLDRTYRELAAVLSISQRLDSDNPERLVQELSKLSRDSSPWRYSARELTALLEEKQGHTLQAIEALTNITSDPQAPADARARAFSLRELYVAGAP